MAEEVIEDTIVGRFQRFDRQCRELAKSGLRSGVAEIFAILAAFFTLGIAVFTAYQINVDLNDRIEERAERNEGRIVRAYETLVRKIGGDTGKGSALSLLIRSEVPLGDLDLSCREIGKWSDGACKSRVHFVRLVAIPRDDNGKRIGRGLYWREFPNLTDSRITRSDFRGFQIRGTKFQNVRFESTDFRSAQIHSLENLQIFTSDLSGATIFSNPSQSLVESNVSGATFVFRMDVENEKFVSPYQFAMPNNAWKRLWYWTDRAPVFIAADDYNGVGVRLPLGMFSSQFIACDPRYRAEAPEGIRTFRTRLHVPRQVFEPTPKFDSRARNVNALLIDDSLEDDFPSDECRMLSFMELSSNFSMFDDPL